MMIIPKWERKSSEVFTTWLIRSMLEISYIIHHLSMKMPPWKPPSPHSWLSSWILSSKLACYILPESVRVHIRKRFLTEISSQGHFIMQLDLTGNSYNPRTYDSPWPFVRTDRGRDRVKEEEMHGGETEVRTAYNQSSRQNALSLTIFGHEWYRAEA